MAAIVRHFGDVADGGKRCGKCDFCAPEECVGQQFRPANEAELDTAYAVIASLRTGGSRSTGKLHAEIHPNGAMTRNDFEQVLGSMARAGLIGLYDAVFEKDGKSIPYRKAGLTPAGNAIDQDTALELVMKEEGEADIFVPRRRKFKGKAKAKAAKRKSVAKAVPAPAAKTASAPALEEALRRWRLAEAKRRGVPAFRIFSDQALSAIAARRPATAAELLAIPGMGINNVEKYGAQLYRLLADAR
jgi:superfamily II DNA helicase RecQ